MRDVRIVLEGQARRVPWRNGRGFTDELALAPEGASFERGDFHWRVSRAAVDANGPFSSFEGFERVLVLLDGAGLWLDHGTRAPRARLRVGEPYRFSGAWPTTAELVGGPVRDFNVVYRPEHASAEVEVLRLGRRRARVAAESATVLLHVPEGALTARVTGEEQSFEVPTGATLLARSLAPGDELDLVGSADGTRALLVRIGPGQRP